MDAIALIRVLGTVVLIVAMVVMLTKKWNGAFTLWFLSIVSLLIVTVVTGSSVVADEANQTGNIFLDVFQVIYLAFKTTLPANTLQVVLVMGYVGMMNQIKAAQMLTVLLLKPLQKLKSKYISIIFVVILGMILRIFIPSQVGLSALFFGIMYPVLLALGLSRVTSAAAIIMATVLDWGPGCPNTGWAFNEPYFAELMDIGTYFVKYQIPICVISMAVAVAVFLFISIRGEEKALEKEAAEFGDAAEKKIMTAEELGVPKGYALLPLLPIVLVLGTSSLFGSGLKVSVHMAHIFCFIVAVVIHVLVSCIRYHRSLVEEVNMAASSMWQEMANSFKTQGPLITGGNVFSTAIGVIGGTTVLLSLLSQTSAGGFIAEFAFCFLVAIIAFLTGTGGAGLWTTAPLLPSVAAASNMNILPMLAPIIMTGCLGRNISLIAPAVLIGAAKSGLSSATLVKRNIIPCICGMVASIIVALVMA